MGMQVTVGLCFYRLDLSDLSSRKPRQLQCGRLDYSSLATVDVALRCR